MDQQITLGYWSGRGRAQVARHLMAYCGVQNWEEKQYSSADEWFKKDKNQLGLPLPNLPYLIDEGFKVTESYAVYRYIINKYQRKDLLGKDLKDSSLVDSFMGAIYDIDHSIVALCFDSKGKQKLGDALKTSIPKLKKMGQIYAQKQYALGYLTVVDFLIAQFSFYLEQMSPENYKQMPFLAKTRKAIEQLPQIKKYYEKQFAIKGPFVETGDFAF